MRILSKITFSLFPPRLIGLFVFALISSAELQAQVVPVNMVAYTGQQAPGMDEGVVFSSLGTRVITNSGIVFLKATVEGNGIDDNNDEGYWVGYPGDLQLVIREGQQVPGMAEGIHFAALGSDSDLRLNSSGEFVLVVTITGPEITEANNRILIYGEGSILNVLLQTGDQAPGLPEGTLIGSLIRSPNQLSESGQYTLDVILSGAPVTTDNDISFWLGDKNQLDMILRDGEIPPDFDPGVVLNMSLSTNSLSVSDTGVLTAHAAYSGTMTGTAIWRGTQNSLTPLYKKGDPAPEIDGYTIGSFYGVKTNNTGHSNFGAYLSPTDSGGTLKATYFYDSSSAHLVVLDGQEAPGLNDGEVIRLGTFPGLNGMNDQGFLVLSLTGSSGRELEGPTVTEDNAAIAYAGYADDLQVVIRDGGTAPDLNSCPTIVNTGFARLSINNQNHAIFYLNMDDETEIDQISALFRWQEGETYNFLREGDTIELTPDQTMDIGLIDLVRPSQDLNDNDDLLVKVYKNGEQAVFVMSTNCSHFFELDLRERYQSGCRNIFDQLRTNYKVCSRS